MMYRTGCSGYCCLLAWLHRVGLVDFPHNFVLILQCISTPKPTGGMKGVIGSVFRRVLVTPGPLWMVTVVTEWSEPKQEGARTLGSIMLDLSWFSLQLSPWLYLDHNSSLCEFRAVTAVMSEGFNLNEILYAKHRKQCPIRGITT